MAEMSSSDSDREVALSSAASDDDHSSSSCLLAPPSPPPASLRPRRRRRQKPKSSASSSASPREEREREPTDPSAEDVWLGAQWEAAWPGRRPKPVVLADDSEEVGRSRSLTDDDLEELKGCADLGFGFSYDEIPELRGTLPALELCYSMSHCLLGAQPDEAEADETHAAAPPPVTNWKISSPGDSPEEVKARLKYWAQAVACTVRLCS